MNFPVYIVNRNRLTTTKRLVDWLLQSQDLEKIVILDNQSTYEPLLEYYSNLPQGVSVKWIGRNGGATIF